MTTHTDLRMFNVKLNNDLRYAKAVAEQWIMNYNASPESKASQYLEWVENQPRIAGSIYIKNMVQLMLESSGYYIRCAGLGGGSVKVKLSRMGTLDYIDISSEFTNE